MASNSECSDWERKKAAPRDFWRNTLLVDTDRHT